MLGILVVAMGILSLLLGCGKKDSGPFPSFRVLAFGYAKTATEVYYRGEPLSGADAQQ